MKKNPTLSIVTPAYNEHLNLPTLYERLVGVLKPLNIEWEWIIIDDHSQDQTFLTANDLAENDDRIRVLRLAHNSGAHVANGCGLEQSRGNCAVVMAADLQDPPETIPELLEKWGAGAQVVWAARRHREGEGLFSLLFSRLFYVLVRRVSGVHSVPSTGADFFLVDRIVVKALKKFRENNANIIALIAWMGFRQARIEYDKAARLQGVSGWSLQKKFKLVIDSVTTFTHVPIRWMFYLGFFVALAGFFYAGIIILNTFGGERPQGWSSLMVVTLFLGGANLCMMGLLGEYLWRTLEESRRRPRYLIEATSTKSKMKKKPRLRKAG